MNLRAIISSLPLLRWLWRLLPGPLRLPLLLIGGAIYLWKRMTGRDVPGDQDAGSADGDEQSR